MIKVWVQQWEESERGWGTRPDGFTAHRNKEDIAKFLKEMRDREAEIYKGATPDEYSRPCGEPFEMELPGELTRKLRGNGVWLPHDWKPNKEADSQREGGWKSMAKT